MTAPGSVLLAVQADNQYTGPIGLVIVVLIGVATVLLILNMNKRIKRLPPTFPERDAADPAQPPADDD